ncbi:hypothetical protein BGZ57DRAFT_930204 [Hyaloscypha finlandica]|nr:hypothetical protein F5882DRAFT_384876 [Hyaloscypha sp. PMI_1271]KAH8767565.1 hypothetical protein BGZ57DRAFT_930204 [Hyaloscypha finlandica]
MPSSKSATGNVPLAGYTIEGTTRGPSVNAAELAIMTSASTPVRAVLWRVVFQTCRGKLYLHQVSLSNTNTGGEVLEKLKLEHQRVMSLHPFHIWDKTPVFFSPVIETAVLSVNSAADLEGQLETRQVFVTQRKRELELTAAFHTPELLFNAKNLVKDNARFEIGNTGAGLEREVLLIGLGLNWIGLLFLILMNLIICIGIGGVVGIATRDVNLGVAVTSGVAAIVACVQAVIFLVFK